ncbi:Eco57I restriction-modification methylase domain-containing protein [Nocardioides aquiterrae]|uniref:Eco57I restriction-modification methylase domain-containing protein n=1 Tax=Nocardioides aquiterrae TaxID=203799 RepID=UPI0031D85E99
MSSFTIDDFLAEAEVQEIDWVRPSGAPASLTPLRVDIGFGPDALEIALATSPQSPKMDDVRRLWSLRWNRRAAPVLLVVGHEGDNGWEATVCGPSDDPAAITGLDLGQVERICAAALSEPNASAAKRTLLRLLTGPKDQLIAGLVNQGLFASHELRHGVPARNDWSAARATGEPLLGKTGADLVAGLGYQATAHGSIAQVLSTDGTRHAVAVLLNEGELFDRPGHRFGSVSPVTHGLSIAQEQNLPWLIVIRGTQLRLYPAKPDVGVGRKGQSETFVELDLALLTADDAGYLPLLFGPTALSENGTVAEILAASVDHATALGARLRDRVYIDVVPALAVAVAKSMRTDKGQDLDEEDLHEAYHRTLTILFRLLFVAYAEDRGLLPYQRNPRYTKKALKTLAREFADDPDSEFDPASHDRWDDLRSVWRAVDDGNREWDVPAYNGGLFAADEALHPSGYAINQMRLSNAEIGPALKALLIDASAEGDLGPVDFRSLSVREFGTIYEGLLESSLSIAPSDLTLDPKTKAYIPATGGSEVVVESGQVYFHNASGARKATGSYFTKAFAVEHLLDAALEPALTDHLDKVNALIDAGDEAGAAETFFDFRVADLAMGSGHFLVAAIDRIENRFAKFLADHPIPSVNDELARLSQAAEEALGDAASGIEIEPSVLLRRQIARRCIYGLDLNLMAVELARLSIWIHTFVPGLPMSSLEHGLRVGDSLTGIGTVDEALDVLEPGLRETNQMSFYSEQIEAALLSAREKLIRVGRTAEATKAEVREAARAYATAMRDAQDARALFDAAVAIRLGHAALPSGIDEAIRIGSEPETRAIMNDLRAAHLPYLFPEVFMRDQGGFDVILGNPPWDEVMIEEPKFWQRHAPGVMGLEPAALKRRIKELRAERPDLVLELEAEQERMAAVRSVLMAGPYPGLTKGDIDYYKAFAWRDWHSLREGGRMGVVFPRSILTASGSAEWRDAILRSGQIDSAVSLTNTGKWVFDEVDGRYTIVLLAAQRDSTGDEQSRVANIAGPFHSQQEFERGVATLGQIPATSLFGWGNGAAFPALPDTLATATFAKFREHTRIDKAIPAFRPIAEFHATNDRETFDAGTSSATRWPVYTGATFNLWDADAGDPYAWADPSTVIEALYAKRVRQRKLRSSAFYGLPGEVASDRATLPCMRPRIVFRDVARSTDSRTCIAALVPGQVVLTNKAPYLWSKDATPRDEAFLLGVLSSVPLDWYARRYVEIGMSLEIFNALPVPQPDEDSQLKSRVVEIAGRLAAADSRYAEWASAVGVPVGSVRDQSDKNDLIAELDAVVALLYRLDRADVEHIFETFHRGWDYAARLDAVLTHYDNWKAKGD